MKAKRTPTVVIASLLTITLGIIIPATASASSTSKNTAKSKSSTASACYKANSARTALKHSIEDADNVLSIASALSSSLNEIQASISPLAILPTGGSQTPRSDLLAHDATLFSKVLAYNAALDSANTILNDSSSKAFKNIVAVKVPSAAGFDASLAAKIYNSTFVAFPSDNAGITITTRNLKENSSNLIGSVDKAYFKSFPGGAINIYAVALKNTTKDMSTYNIPEVVSGFQLEMRWSWQTNGSWQGPSFDDYWQSLIADATYMSVETDLVTSLAQHLKLASSAALLKLPKC